MPEIGLYDYVYAPEIIRITVLIGVVVSALVYERLQLTTGGAIVPAFLAVSLPHPTMILTTLAVSAITWAIVHKLLPRWFILYGRQRVEVEYLVGVFFVLLAAGTAAFLGASWPELMGYTVIGMLIPGIVAHDMGRQGPLRTLGIVTITTLLLGVIVFVIDQIFALVRMPMPALLTILPKGGYPDDLLLIAVALSLIISVVLFATLKIRSGGFVTGAYLAFIATRPIDIVFVYLCAGLTWLIVVHVLIPRLLLFGRRKLTTMMLVAGIVTWAMEIVVYHATLQTYLPWYGLTVITLIAPALLANDAQRQGWRRTLWASVMSAVGVFAVMNLVAAGLVAAGLMVWP